MYAKETILKVSNDIIARIVQITKHININQAQLHMTDAVNNISVMVTIKPV